LRSIEGDLAESDPDLVARLAMLSRLMPGENNRAGDRSQARWLPVFLRSLLRWLPGPPRRSRARTHSTCASALMACGLLTACPLTATAALLSHVGPGGRCSALAVTCGSQPPASQTQHGAR